MNFKRERLMLTAKTESRRVNVIGYIVMAALIVGAMAIVFTGR